MKTFDYTIKDELGIHARPAGILAKEAKKFTSECTLTKDGNTKKLTQLMMLMSLGVKQGETVTVTAEGADEDEAIAALKAVFEENLQENALTYFLHMIELLTYEEKGNDRVLRL